MRNPALRARGQDVRLVFFDGTATTVKGVIGLAETSAGEAGQAFAEAGALAWLDYGGDGQQIEFLEYIDKASGARLHRRKIKAEIVGTIFPTLKVHMRAESTVMPRLQRDFSELDFNPAQFG